jgi:hypothetical protein
MPKPSPQELAEIVNRLLLTKGQFSSAEAVEAVGISRQALHRHLTRMVASGTLVRVGQGRGAHYVGPENAFHRFFSRSEVRGEDQVWAEVRAAIPRLAEQEAANAIYAYAFTEMVNNALDHSGSPTIDVHGKVDSFAGKAWFSVNDSGIGAFENVRRRFGLVSHLEAIEAISKGKVSTQPDRHSGEGIFFTSKMGSTFSLRANGLVWIVDNVRDDQSIAKAPDAPGTTVDFEVPLATTVTPKSVFERYSHDFEFDTSRAVIKLFERGGEYVSRSEAKRVVAGLERFREVIVDFHRVESVGQGFADEIFRVWAREHPETKLVPDRMNEVVTFMVERARRAAAAT